MAVEQIGYARREPEVVGEDQRTRNWARNATLGRPDSVVAPAGEDELRTFLAATSGPVRMIGSRMSPGRLLGVDGDEAPSSTSLP